MSLSSKSLAHVTSIAMILLIVLCAIWESIGAPLRLGGTFFVFKGALLLPFLAKIWQGQRRSFISVSLIVLLYILEGLTRSYADINPISRIYAVAEVVVSLWVFIFSISYLKLTSNITRAPRERAIKSRLIFWFIALVWLQLLMPSIWQAEENNETSYLIVRFALAVITGILLLTYLFRLYQVSKITQSSHLNSHYR